MVRSSDSQRSVAIVPVEPWSPRPKLPNLDPAMLGQKGIHVARGDFCAQTIARGGMRRHTAVGAVHDHHFAVSFRMVQLPDEQYDLRPLGLDRRAIFEADGDRSILGQIRGGPDIPEHRVLFVEDHLQGVGSQRFRLVDRNRYCIVESFEGVRVPGVACGRQRCSSLRRGG